MIFLMLKILHLFVLMELDPSFPTRLCPCQSAHPASLLHCGSHWGFLQDKMMTLCLKQLGCFLSTLTFLSLWNALVSFSTFSSSWNVKSRVKSAGEHSVIEEPSSSQSHRTCKFICIMSGTLQGPGSASPPVSWTEDSTRRAPFLLFCKSPPSLLALGLSLNSVWIDVVWIKIGLPSSVGEIPLQSNFKGI